ncbi:MAG: hypothetical protein ABSE53_12860 [Terracidiphilus sp.]|jgi:hypothetical protein
MELFCNLAWVAVTVALWGSWFVRRRHARTVSILPAIAAQLISLAALTAILLPVISITDDLQAANNPAEVERSAGKRDHLFSFQQALHGAPGIVALVVPAFRPSLLTRFSLLPTDSADPSEGTAHLLAPWSRPPPAA